MTKYIDFFVDPDTGEMEIKIEGMPDGMCDAVAAEILKKLGLTDAKVTKTASANEGGGQKRSLGMG
jgi:DNA-binding transcriptional regulator LsrR (DeoR family)